MLSSCHGKIAKILGMIWAILFSPIGRKTNISTYNTHMIHVWYIYLQNWAIFGGNVGKYSSTMEHILWIQKKINLINLIWKMIEVKPSPETTSTLWKKLRISYYWTWPLTSLIYLIYLYQMLMFHRFWAFFYRGPLRRQSVLSVPALRNRWSRISAPLPCTVRRDFRRSQEMVHQPLLVVQKKWVWVNTY